jgi:DNA polymerase-3 subunit epsilon
MNPSALTETTVLILDCQASGPKPGRDHLLEIGWAAFRAVGDSGARDIAVHSHLVKPDDAAVLPRGVRRVTGLTAADLEGAGSRRKAWDELQQGARAVAAVGRRQRCPTVIHYASFETPYLKALHAEFEPAAPFPFQIVCTHAIAARLMPELPRKGLRAVAGYFGFALDGFHRSAAHVAATAWIWRELAGRLESEHGITGIEELCAWLARPRLAAKTRKRVYPMDPQCRQGLPDKPGIYRMLGKNDRLLYIGKALSLRKRVAGYFRPGTAHAEHVLEMLSQAFRVDYTLAATGVEAALLEADLIKEEAPPYNIALKSGERRLIYCSPDFQLQADGADRDHSVGPLPAGRAPAFLKSFGAWMASGFGPAGESLLGLPPEHAPDKECLAQGLGLFVGRYRRYFRVSSALRVVARLGADLNHRRLALPQEDPQDSEPVAEEPPADWSPEAVAALLEQAVDSSARLIRRGRWFRLLCESTLGWSLRTKTDSSRRVLVLRGGRVVSGGDAPAAEPLPAPDARPSRHAAPDPLGDILTYDRLRVLTTELRRLAQENRPMWVRPAGGRILDGRRLQMLLRWV